MVGLISSTKPGPWTLSPQMTAAPELWRDVISVGAVWNGTGNPYDLRLKTFHTLKNGPSWLGSRFGRVLQFNDGGREAETIQADALADWINSGVTSFTYLLYVRFPYSLKQGH